MKFFSTSHFLMLSMISLWFSSVAQFDDLYYDYRTDGQMTANTISTSNDNMYANRYGNYVDEEYNDMAYDSQFQDDEYYDDDIYDDYDNYTYTNRIRRINRISNVAYYDNFNVWYDDFYYNPAW